MYRVFTNIPGRIRRCVARPYLEIPSHAPPPPPPSRSAITTRPLRGAGTRGTFPDILGAVLKCSTMSRLYRTSSVLPVNINQTTENLNR